MSIKKKLKASTGLIKSDKVLKNGNIINVFTNEIVKGDIAIVDDTIVGIGKYSGNIEFDVSNKYISPGFIDSHIHIESSMLCPNRFANLVAKDGTTTIIADPHEIVNVSGNIGLDYMLKSTENTNCDVFFMLPSCVPATDFENNGASFTSEDIKSFLNSKYKNRILGLGEVMDYIKLINYDTELHNKLDFCNNLILDGHAPNITGSLLQAYRLSGIITDHECTDISQALEKLRLGFYILIREGSAAQNLENVLGGIIENKLPLDRCCFCTDDKHINDIILHGHITTHIRKAIKLGLNPIQAIRLATINTASLYNIKNIGAIAPSYLANLVVLDDLNTVTVNSVYHKGNNINDNKNDNLTNVPYQLKSSVNTVDIKQEDLNIYIEKNSISIISLMNNQIITKHIKEQIKSNNGIFIPYDNYQKLVVIERHNRKGNIGLGILKGYNIKNAAIGSTVSHDSHNIIIAGDNDKDIINVLNELKNIGGGYVISNNSTIHSIKLEISGIITDTDPEILAKDIHYLTNLAYKLGVPKYFDPFITLSFLALPVIPEIRLTDKGLFDVLKFKHIEL